MHRNFPGGAPEIDSARYDFERLSLFLSLVTKKENTLKLRPPLVFSPFQGEKLPFLQIFNPTIKSNYHPSAKYEIVRRIERMGKESIEAN